MNFVFMIQVLLIKSYTIRMLYVGLASHAGSINCTVTYLGELAGKIHLSSDIIYCWDLLENVTLVPSPWKGQERKTAAIESVKASDALQLFMAAD